MSINLTRSLNLENIVIFSTSVQVCCVACLKIMINFQCKKNGNKCLEWGYLSLCHYQSIQEKKRHLVPRNRYPK